MKRMLIKMTALSALVVLLAGGAAAQTLPSASIFDGNPLDLDPGDGRVFTHNVLSEVGTPTG